MKIKNFLQILFVFLMLIRSSFSAEPNNFFSIVPLEGESFDVVYDQDTTDDIFCGSDNEEDVYDSKKLEESCKFLFDAVSSDDIETVKNVLSLEQSFLAKFINSTDKHGRTAIMLAADQCKLEMVKLLLTVDGIDVNTIDETGNTAISLAIGKAQSLYVYEFVLHQDYFSIVECIMRHVATRDEVQGTNFAAKYAEKYIL